MISELKRKNKKVLVQKQKKLQIRVSKNDSKFQDS